MMKITLTKGLGKDFVAKNIAVGSLVCGLFVFVCFSYSYRCIAFGSMIMCVFVCVSERCKVSLM